MNWSKALVLFGLALTLAGAVLGAKKAALPLSTVLVASSYEDMEHKRRSVGRWLQISLILIAAGTAFQMAGALVAR